MILTRQPGLGSITFLLQFPQSQGRHDHRNGADDNFTHRLGVIDLHRFELEIITFPIADHLLQGITVTGRRHFWRGETEDADGTSTGDVGGGKNLAAPGPGRDHDIDLDRLVADSGKIQDPRPVGAENFKDLGILGFDAI